MPGPVSPPLTLWLWWLVALNAMSCLVGVLLVVAPLSGPMAPYNRALANALWHLPELPTSAHAYHQWAMAVIGSATAGWALTNLFVLWHAFRRGQRWAHRALFWSLLAWATLDIAISLRLRAYAEVMFVLTVAALALVPLIATWRHFSPAALQPSQPPV